MMDISTEIYLLVASLMVFVSILISRTGYRFGVPTLLMFLLAGMIFGGDGLGIQFNNVKDAQNVGMAALSIILFTGGMDTKLDNIRPVMAPGLTLATVGVLLTTLFTGLFVFLLTMWKGTPINEFTLTGALLLAATMSSTDSASVFNILRSHSIRLKNNLRPLLELESGSNDPMAYLLTIMLIHALQVGGLSGWELVGSFLAQFTFGIGVGLLLGKCSVWVINHIHLTNSTLYSVLTLSLIFIIYCAAYLIGGNGYLAVYLAGIVMGNAKMVKKKEVSTFLDGMTWLFQVVMFLMLGMLVNPHEMVPVLIPAILIGLFMMLIARPLGVWLCLLPFGKQLKANSKMFVSWVGLRGAAPIIFATYPVIADIPGARNIFNIVFFVTLLSLILQGTTLAKAARRLRLIDYTKTGHNYFGIQIPDSVSTSLHELECTPQMLAQGNKVKDLRLEPGLLIMLIKRDERFLVPNGQLDLLPGDIMLLIKEE